MTPRDVDTHSFRDLWVMLNAARERETNAEKEAWRRSLFLTQAIQNTMSKKPKPLDYLAKKLLDTPTTNRPTLAEYKTMRDQAVAKVREKNGGTG